MSKHHHTHKTSSTNRMGNTAVSVDPESPNQTEEQAKSTEPTYADIQKRAYEIHESKGGSDLENWLEAEKALKEEGSTIR